ncbi:MAG: CPBP family intramembrane metalloprotease [Methylococcaceae bacterium]|nr:CPBP family intramembrane metalloprotease [Methylococcaceae bacterium]
MDSSPNSKEFFKSACYFESSLILIAVVLGWLTDTNPFADLYFSEMAVFYGIIGTLPLFLLFLMTEQLSFEPVRKIRQLLWDTLGESFSSYNWADLFILAAIAGISEEILFRGALQPWLEQSLGMNAGLIVSSIVFGLVHAVTPLYAVLAGLISLYLGLSLDYGESRNLLTPIIIHALYDFLAFIVLMKAYKANINNHQSSD